MNQKKLGKIEKLRFKKWINGKDNLNQIMFPYLNLIKLKKKPNNIKINLWIKNN